MRGQRSCCCCSDTLVAGKPEVIVRREVDIRARTDFNDRARAPVDTAQRSEQPLRLECVETFLELGIE